MCFVPKAQKRVSKSVNGRATIISHGGKFTICLCWYRLLWSFPDNLKVIVVFSCLTTKACHLELVGDLSTDAFVATITRFVSRRGLPAHIFSDNGRNFLGAKRRLDELNKFLS